MMEIQSLETRLSQETVQTQQTHTPTDDIIGPGSWYIPGLGDKKNNRTSIEDVPSAYEIEGNTDPIPEIKERPSIYDQPIDRPEDSKKKTPPRRYVEIPIMECH
jgi:hypothetical protein